MYHTCTERIIEVRNEKVILSEPVVLVFILINHCKRIIKGILISCLIISYIFCYI